MIEGIGADSDLHGKSGSDQLCDRPRRLDIDCESGFDFDNGDVEVLGEHPIFEDQFSWAYQQIPSHPYPYQSSLSELVQAGF